MPVVGVDIGTQSLKAVVCDDDLAVLGEASRGYAPVFPRPGWAEQDPSLWEAALGPAIAEALGAAGVAPGAVRGLGIAGQLDGCVPVDADGRALGPCLIWMDRRATAELPPLPDDFRQTTGLVADAGHMAAKIRWLSRHAGGAAAYHQPVSYLVARLCGASVFDHGLASTTMLYALARRDYDPALLARFAIEPATLPAIAEASALAGTLHADGAALAGLPEGTPLAVGTGDDFATPLGAGIVEPGQVACVLGTAEVVGALSDEPVDDPGALVECHAYATRRFFVENPGWLAGGAMAWLGEMLGVDDFAALDALAEDAPAGADGLTFLPALSGAMAPEWHAGARGCFYGLTPAHHRGHLVRAVMEGCAFAMRDVVDRLRALGVPARAIVLLGGGARSELWARMRADVVGLPVEVAPRVDTCPVGAAMLAAVAAGVQPDLPRCAKLVAGARERREPEGADAVAYADAYGAYRRLFDSLRPMFE